MNEQIYIFDRGLVRRRRERAAAGFGVGHSVLQREVAALLVERLGDVKREFGVVLDLGAHDGFLARELARREGRFVVAADLSRGMLKAGGHSVCVAADEEFLPFAEGSFDLIVSNLSLHWVNDLPGALAQIRRALRPGGLFLAALLGGGTLQELRACLVEAEIAVMGGVSPRVSPSIDAPTASALLQRAGFALPVTDQELLTFSYPDSFALMRDLRGMGEGNALAQRSRGFTRREVFAVAEGIYRERFGLGDGRVGAGFEVVFLHGWA